MMIDRNDCSEIQGLNGVVRMAACQARSVKIGFQVQHQEILKPGGYLCGRASHVHSWQSQWHHPTETMTSRDQYWLQEESQQINGQSSGNSVMEDS